jgi:hypothetical protein
MWERQLRPLLHEQKANGGYVILLRLAELAVPFREFVGVFDIPNHPLDYIPLVE